MHNPLRISEVSAILMILSKNIETVKSRHAEVDSSDPLNAMGDSDEEETLAPTLKKATSGGLFDDSDDDKAPAPAPSKSGASPAKTTSASLFDERRGSFSGENRYKSECSPAQSDE